MKKLYALLLAAPLVGCTGMNHEGLIPDASRLKDDAGRPEKSAVSRRFDAPPALRPDEVTEERAAQQIRLLAAEMEHARREHEKPIESGIAAVEGDRKGR